MTVVFSSRARNISVLSNRRRRRGEVCPSRTTFVQIQYDYRRLLYVACTRAQGLLYLSHAAKRKVAGETKTKELSEFISAVTKQNQARFLELIMAKNAMLISLQTLFSTSKPRLDLADRAVISTVLSRPLPDDFEVSRRVAELSVFKLQCCSYYTVTEMNV